jgi:hypothetical protein
VRTTHNKTKGYGLGLYICAEIIRAHKGKIGVKSKEMKALYSGFHCHYLQEAKHKSLIIMPKENTTDLKEFLAPFSAEVQELALWLREFVWDLYPNANELIYDITMHLR